MRWTASVGYRGGIVTDNADYGCISVPVANMHVVQCTPHQGLEYGICMEITLGWGIGRQFAQRAQ